METLSTSPQPLHEMVPVLLILSLILMAAFLLLARIVNWIAKRPLANGGAIFFWLLLVLVVGFAAYSFIDTRILGQATAALIPSLAISFFLGRRFRKHKAIVVAEMAQKARHAKHIAA